MDRLCTVRNEGAQDMFSRRKSMQNASGFFLKRIGRPCNGNQEIQRRRANVSAGFPAIRTILKFREFTATRKSRGNLQVALRLSSVI